MKRELKMAVLVAMLGWLGISSHVYAQAPVDLTEDEIKMVEKRRERRAAFKSRMKEELGLTDEQQQKLQAHRQNHRGQRKQVFQQMMSLRDELKAELEKINIDTAKAHALNDQIKKLTNQMADHRLEGILQLRKILTVEQFKKFSEKTGKWRGTRGDKSFGSKGYHGKFDFNK